ncbi:MAG: EamA family transporter [Clostridia bacterium]|nr:EamA family transporter [Clostridia bacterium]
MWFILSLTAFLFWSGSDFFSKLGSHPRDKQSHWKMVMAVGLVMGLHAAYEIFFNEVAFSFADMLMYLPASALYIGSMVLGYVGLRYIELSVSSPICNCSGALAAVFCFIFLQELPAPIGWVGVACIAVGLVSLAIVERRESDEAKDLRRAEGLKYTRSVLALALPRLYCLLDALGTFIDAVILREEDTGTFFDILPTLAEEKANVCYELTFLFMGILAAIYVFVIRRERLIPAAKQLEEDGRTPKQHLVRHELPKLAAGVCETAGQFAYVFALTDTAHVGFSAAIISSYCAMSVLLSRLFLKEKLSLWHYLAILVAFAGIMILGISDP